MKSKKILSLIDDSPTLVSPERQETIIQKSFDLNEVELLTAYTLFDEVSSIEALVELAREKAVTCVVCYRLSVIRHFIRDFISLCELVVRLHEVGISFQSIEEDVNTRVESAYLKRLILGWKMSKDALKKENPKISQLKAKLKGKKLGRPQKRDDLQIRILRQQGLSIRDIAARTGVSTNAVHRSLMQGDSKN